jgi:hypothetical protein
LGDLRRPQGRIKCEKGLRSQHAKERSMLKKPSVTEISTIALLTAILVFSVVTRLAVAQQADGGETSATDASPGDPSASARPGASSPAKPQPPPKLPEPKGAKRISPEFDVWVDPKGKTVIIDGQVSLREGMLEMFACTRNTKEHESIVSANTKAYIVHAALLSLGAEAGHPAQWVPEYKPPAGTEIEITVYWLDEKEKEQTARAQDWVKDIHTGTAMTHPWVFAGSRFWTDEQTGEKYYQAEGGDFICVSNFSTAMLDIPIESSQSNAELAFEAFTERIPPLGAPVRLILKPKLKERGAGSKEQGNSAQGFTQDSARE